MILQAGVTGGAMAGTTLADGGHRWRPDTPVGGGGGGGGDGGGGGGDGGDGSGTTTVVVVKLMADPPFFLTMMKWQINIFLGQFDSAKKIGGRSKNGGFCALKGFYLLVRFNSSILKQISHYVTMCSGSVMSQAVSRTEKSSQMN